MLIKQFWIIPYKIASDIDDVWMSYAGESEKGWIVDGKLYIDPKREKFLEAAKTLTENDWIYGTYTWTDGLIIWPEYRKILYSVFSALPGVEYES